jgi:uncharacterized lipoprotein YddW (UPF0748 family)
VDELVRFARAANINALFVQVRRRGDAYYVSSLEPRTEDADLQAGFDPLAYLIQQAHSGPRPLQVHAWLATLPVWGSRDVPPIDPRHVLNQHGLDPTDPSTWLMLRDDGVAFAGSGSAGIYYMDPGNPDAARYTADVYLDLLRHYDVDGIHLDQVRYYEGDAGHWGYNPTSVARFNQAYGRDPGTQPSFDDPDWATWRRDQVTALVRRIYLETKALKPNVAVLAAVATGGDGPQRPGDWEGASPYAAVFQDWRTWLQAGILDFAVPMNYYREDGVQANWLDDWTHFESTNQGARAVSIGLGSYLNGPDEAAAQVQRARSLHTLGVTLYSYAVPDASASDTDWQTAHTEALNWLQVLFPKPAAVPDLPWMARPTTGNLLVDVPGREGLRVSLTGPVVRTWTTDGTGLAGAVSLPPGPYIVSVDSPDVVPSASSIVISAGKTTAVRYGPGTAAR